jgi:hypothetical protein
MQTSYGMKGKRGGALNYLKKMHSIIVPKSTSSNQQAGENTEGPI